MSGCFDDAVGDAEGADTDDSDTVVYNYNNTTIVNNFFNNSTTHSDTQLTYFQNGEIVYFSEYDKGTWTVVDHGGGSSSASWVGSPTQQVDIMTIMQDENESLMIQRIDIWAETNYTNCEQNHSQEGRCNLYSGSIIMEDGVANEGYSPMWHIECAQGLEISTSNLYQGLSAPFSGSECNYTLSWGSEYNADSVFWSVEYQIVDVVEGPHN